MAASMGAFLLSSGAKGKRYCMPNARVMIHQPLGGVQGQCQDMIIQTTEMMYHKGILNGYIAEFCGKSYEQVLKDTEKDFFMGPEESVEYGIIDAVLDVPKWKEGAATQKLEEYDFDSYDWRTLGILDPSHPDYEELPLRSI